MTAEAHGREIAWIVHSTTHLRRIRDPQSGDWYDETFESETADGLLSPRSLGAKTGVDYPDITE